MTKLKRHKHMKKTVLFYKNYFRFESPFQVLIDGTFCKEALKVKVDIREQLPKYLDSEVDLLTTQCAKAECELFGSSHDMPLYGARIVISNFKIHPCGHEKPISPSKCLREMAKKNGKFFIATQEKALTEKLRKIPGVPILYIAFNAITLEAPSEASKNYEKDRLKSVGLSDFEKSTIKELKTETFGPETEKKLKKRRKKKGPNPLSCKKKKSKPLQPVTSEANGRKKRKRIRKHKSKNILANQSVFQ